MKHVIVTGANSGLGLWTTKYLMDLGYHVIMACRNTEKAQKAVDDFLNFGQSTSYTIKRLDLSDFDSIKHFVSDLNEFETIDSLDCNAGISYEGPFRYTKNGIEETFGTNHLGHFLLTNLLLRKYDLKRIVIVSSELHNPKNKSPFANAEFKSISELAYPSINQQSTLVKQSQSFYATSKLCNLLFAYELDRRLQRKATPTLVNAINPGLMLTTNLGRTFRWGEALYRHFLHGLFKLIGLADTPQSSAKAVVQLLDQVTTSGQYYDKSKPIASSHDSYDTQKALQLWEGSEQLVGDTFLTS